MKKILFITHRYVSRFLVAILLTYVYIAHTSPSHEGKLEKSSPAFFAQELEDGDDADEHTNNESADGQDGSAFNQE